MSSKIGKLKKLSVFSGVCSGATMTPKFYFISRCLLYRTTISQNEKECEKCLTHSNVLKHIFLTFHGSNLHNNVGISFFYAPMYIFRCRSTIGCLGLTLVEAMCKM